MPIAVPRSLSSFALRCSARPNGSPMTSGTHPIGKSRFHYVVVRRFPYRLIYCFDSESTARVVAVTHLRRRPGYWSRRGSP